MNTAMSEKEFAHQMVKDDATFNHDLKALAVQKGVTLPDSLDLKKWGPA